MIVKTSANIVIYCRTEDAYTYIKYTKLIFNLVHQCDVRDTNSLEKFSKHQNTVFFVFSMYSNIFVLGFTLLKSVASTFSKEYGRLN